jgi:hypothetical protein
MKPDNDRYTTFDGWPGEQYKFLLQSAFLTESSQVRPIWEQWQSHNSWSRIDHASRAILPAVLQNLLKHGAYIDSDVRQNIQKQYFNIFMRNQQLFKEASKLIHQLHQAGFKTMLLKGTALALQYYNKLGQRFMSDVDILIPTHQALDGIAYMLELGYKPVSRGPEKFSIDYVTVSHGHEFHHPDGRKIDLHWHVMHECCQPDSDTNFWDAAIPINVSGINTHALNPADQLLHTCVHSARFGSSIPLRSLVDVMIILNQSSIDLDWDRLLSQAKKRKLILPVRETLFYVLKYLNANIPGHISKQLWRASVTKYQQIEYSYKRQNYHQKKLGYFPIMIFDYLRLRHHMRLWEYLRRFWGTSSNRESLRFLLHTLLKKT